MYLIFGQDRALLLDTGDGVTLAPTVYALVAQWKAAKGIGGAYELVVAHTHAHGDHVQAPVARPALFVDIALGHRRHATCGDRLDDGVPEALPGRGEDDEVGGESCRVAGGKCDFGCDDNLGCVECRGDSRRPCVLSSRPACAWRPIASRPAILPAGGQARTSVDPVYSAVRTCCPSTKRARESKRAR